MNDFTYETKDRTHKYETYEWDNTWIDHANDLEAKRVLYIGDSISCAIRRFATEKTDEKILFDLFGSSRGLDNPFFKDALSIFIAQQGRRDAVLFNNGLHGFNLQDVNEYKYYYERMIKFLLEKCKNTPLILVLSTHVKTDTAIVVSRNKAVLELATKYSLPTIDLYSVSEEAATLHKDDGVHFTDEGSKLFADKIITSLVEIVPNLKY